MTLAPAQFYVRLQHGIRGGFAPPTPNEVHVLSRAPDTPNELLIQSEIRHSGSPELTGLAPKYVKLGSGSDDKESRIAELHQILKSIPTEQPPGSEDIYGLDTQIMWGSDDLEWCNGSPQGCGTDTSIVQPTAADKQKFQRAVDIVKALTL